MTSKEAVNLFKQYNWSVVNENKYKALEILEELVERDTPMKVIKTQNWSYHCPRCNGEIDVSDVDYDCKQIYRYCYYCGQRLDWELEK